MMNRVYEIKDWQAFFNGISRSTVSRYMKVGLIRKPDITEPRPLWNEPPSLTASQSSQSTSTS